MRSVCSSVRPAVLRGHRAERSDTKRKRRRRGGDSRSRARRVTESRPCVAPVLRGRRRPSTRRSRRTCPYGGGRQVHIGNGSSKGVRRRAMARRRRPRAPCSPGALAVQRTPERKLRDPSDGPGGRPQGRSRQRARRRLAAGRTRCARSACRESGLRLPVAADTRWPDRVDCQLVTVIPSIRRAADVRRKVRPVRRDPLYQNLRALPMSEPSLCPTGGSGPFSNDRRTQHRVRPLLPELGDSPLGLTAVQAFMSDNQTDTLHSGALMRKARMWVEWGRTETAVPVPHLAQRVEIRTPHSVFWHDPQTVPVRVKARTKQATYQHEHYYM